MMTSPILSVDLAYKTFRDVGAVILRQEREEISCELAPIPLSGDPDPDQLAQFLVEYCEASHVRIILLDGPQGWKSGSNSLIHSRTCERELNTPAKSGLPGCVKPENYRPFVEFSIAVFDALSRLGWSRLPASQAPLSEQGGTAVESFPLSAWRSLGIKALPAKAKARPIDLKSALESLMSLVPLRVAGTPSHDELQAIVAGLAGIALQGGRWDRCAVAGTPPVLEEGIWREGFIIKPVRTSS